MRLVVSSVSSVPEPPAVSRAQTISQKCSRNRCARLSAFVPDVHRAVHGHRVPAPHGARPAPPRAQRNANTRTCLGTFRVPRTRGRRPEARPAMDGASRLGAVNTCEAPSIAGSTSTLRRSGAWPGPPTRTVTSQISCHVKFSLLEAVISQRTCAQG